jgi:RNA polymerase sigma-70 factor, ECF subfamily
VLRRDEERASARLIPYDTDLSAVEAARRDPHRFETLYRKYVAQVYSFALYELRDTHAAEDATARTFMNALAGLPRFAERSDRPDGSFRAWLFQIARNAIANERRHARRHPTTTIDAALAIAAPAHAGTDPATAAVRREELARAWQQVEALPEERRRALVLRFVLELSTREIAALMGKTEGAVRVLLHRALRSVARGMPERD